MIFLQRRADSLKRGTILKRDRNDDSSSRWNPRVRPHSGCSTLGIGNRGIVWAGLTDAGTPCACFRDRGMSADAPKSHCKTLLMIKELRPPKPTVTGNFSP